MDEQKMDKYYGDFNIEQLIVGLLKTNKIYHLNRSEI